MKITIGFEKMGVHGLLRGNRIMEVEQDTAAGHIEAALKKDHELLTGWWVELGPKEFKARIAEEGAGARKAVVDRWNHAVLDALPKVIADLEAEQAERGGNWGASAILNARESVGAAERCAAAGVPFRTGALIREAKDNHHIGVSGATWSRVHGAVPAEARLPLGLI